MLVDIYGPESHDIQPVDDAFGKSLLVKAMKHAAMSIDSIEKTNYLADKKDYKDCIRATDIGDIGCWYGFIYTKNNSPYRLKETITLDLKGLEIVHPVGSEANEPIEIDIESGDDHVIVLRRFANECKYSTAYRTRAREFTNDELV